MTEAEWLRIPSNGTAFPSGNVEETDYTKFFETNWNGSITIDVMYTDFVMLYGFDIFRLDYPEMETLKSLYKDCLLEQGAIYLEMCLEKEGNNA